VQPLLGRNFTIEDDRQDTAILGYGLWQSRFGGDPQVLGKKIILTDRLGLDNAYPPAVIGNALKSFVKTLNTAVPGSQFALTTFDGPVVRVANFGLPLTELDKLLGRLATVAQDAAIRDAMMDVCAHAQKAPTPRRAIFTVFAGYRPDAEESLASLAAARGFVEDTRLQLAEGASS